MSDRNRSILVKLVMHQISVAKIENPCHLINSSDNLTSFRFFSSKEVCSTFLILAINSLNQAYWGKKYTIVCPFNLSLALFCFILSPIWSLFNLIWCRWNFPPISSHFLSSSPPPRHGDPRIQQFVLPWMHHIPLFIILRKGRLNLPKKANKQKQLCFSP